MDTSVEHGEVRLVGHLEQRLTRRVETNTPPSSRHGARPPQESTTSHLKIAVLAERRYLTQRQPFALAAALMDAGHRADLLVPQALALDLGRCGLLDADGVVARGRSDVLLAMLRVLELTGMPTINRAASVA